MSESSHWPKVLVLVATVFALGFLLLPNGAQPGSSKEPVGGNRVPQNVQQAADSHLAGLPTTPTELVRADYAGKKAKDVPEATSETEAFYQKAKVLEQRDSPPNADGVTKRERLIYAEGEKYPKIRVEEQVRVDPKTGTETLVSRVAMVADHVLVQLPPKVSDDQLKQVADRYGLTLNRRLQANNMAIFDIPEAQLESVPLALKKLGAQLNAGIPVVTAEPDFVVHASQTNRVPNDSSFSNLWAMQNTGQTGGQSGDDIAATGAWSMSTGTASVVVAVIDTGIDMKHPDLAANIYANTHEIAGNGTDDDHSGYIDDVHGWNFVADTNDPTDDHYHGTHCAGTIGAVGDNGNGVAGVNWHVRLLPLKFLSSSGAGATSDAIEAIAYATAMHVDVMSNSWGGGGYSALLKSAIEDAGNQGIVFVAAAGNDACNTDVTPQYPSAYNSPSIISVAASDANDQLAGFSNYGSTSVDLAAPGVGIYSTAPGNSYRYLNGTSMATPHVAGACALLKALAPSLSVADIKSRLLASVDQKPGLAATVSHGRLNVMKLLYNASGPLVRLLSLNPSDAPAAGAQGNGDGIINPGENIVVQPVLENTGSETAQGVTAVMSLKTPNSYVKITQPNCAYPDIQGRQTATGRVPFRVQIDAAVPTPLTVTLLLQVSDTAGHSWQSASDLTIYRSSTVSGRVTASGSGTALSAATVSYSGPVSGSVTAAADGTYAVALIDGTYSLTAAANGYQSSDPLSVSVPPAASGINFALGKPSVSITPSSLEVSLNQGQSAARTLTISNSGNRPLNYTILTGYGLSSYLNVRQSGTNVGAADSSGLPFFEDFESGTMANWTADATTGARNIDSQIAAAGKYSLHIKSGNTNWHQSGVHHDLATSAQPKNIRFSVRADTRQNDAAFFVVYDRSTNKELIWFYAASTGSFYCNGSTGGNQTYAYEAQRWYDIEFRNINWITKKFDYYVNGFPVQTGVAFRNPTGVTGASRVYLYNYDSSSEAWWDNIVISGDGVSWLGESPTSGTVAAGGTQNVTVNFNATALPNADYTANLVFQTNAPSNPTVTIPATLHVLSLPNNPPVAISKTVTSPEDTDATITLQGSDPNGNLISAVVTSLPAKGALYQVFSTGALGPQITSVPATVVSPDFKVLFRPVLYQDGTPYDAFGFKMNDGKADSAPATITVNVTHVNHAPVARNDVASSPTGGAIPSIPVLVNDSDPDNDALAIVSITQGIHGTAAINANGTLSYTPKTGFTNGNDTFTYTVRDPAGLTATATVLVRVGNLMGGDWPTFGVNAQHTGYYPACLQGGTFQAVWAQQFDCAPNQVAIAGGRIYSTPSIYFDQATLRSIDLSSGAQVWSRDFGTPYSLNPPTWFNGKVYVQQCDNWNDTYLYCVDAASGSLNWSAPFGSQWEHYYAPAVTANGVWMDGGSYGGLYGFNLDGTQKFFSSSLAQYDQWTPTIGSDGTVYSWVTGVFRAHNPSTGVVNWSLTTASTGTPYSVNTVSAIANNSAYAIGSAGLYCFNLVSHSQAWLNNNSFKGSPAVANGIVYAISGSQVLSFDANSGASLGAFQTGDSGLFYQPTVTDDSLLISSSSNTYIFSLSTRQRVQTIPFGGYLSLSDGALVIAGNSDKYLRVYRISASGNHVPVATSQTVSMVEDSAATVTLTGTDADAEPVYPVLSRLPMKGTVYQTVDGVTRGSAITVVPSLISDPKGRVIYAAAQYGSGVNFDAFGFEVCDGRSISPEATVSFNVTHVNHAPVANDDAIGVRPGQPVTIRPTLNDQDVDGDPLTIQSFTQGAHGAVTQNAGGTLLYTPNANFTAGQDTFTYTIADPAGLTSSAKITVAIGQLLNGADWTTFGNGPAHTSYSAWNLGPQPWVEQWNRNFSPSTLNQVATGDGKVFVIPTGYFATSQVWALDGASGAEIWRRDIGNCYSMDPPTYADGKVYFQNGAGTSTPPSQLSCVDSSDGHDLWKMPIAAQWENYYAPTVADGGVWVNGGTYGGMYGFDAATGAQKFFVNLDQVDNWTPAYVSGTLYSCLNGNLRAHSSTSGTTLWNVSIDSGISDSSLVVADSLRAYIATSKGLYCVRTDTHIVSWKQAASFKGHAALANGLAYAMTNTGEVRAFNASTGQQLYTYATGDSGLMYQPIVTNDMLLVASASKTYVFELYTARLLQTISLGGKLSLANEKIYIAGNDGTLHVFGRPASNNQKPVAVAAQATILEDSQVALALEGTDADGDRLHAIITQLPAKGALYQTSDGSTAGTQILRLPTLVTNDRNTVIYVPDAGGNGVGYGSFQFAMSDGIEVSGPAVFKIDVTAVNDAPVSYNDNITTSPGHVIADLRLLANDVDIDGDPLTIISFTAPAHGVVERNGDGSLRYTPDPAFISGTDVFTYTVSDPSGVTSTGTATILVSGSAGVDWPTFGNGPDHTGYSPVNLGSQTWVAGWTTNLGTSALNQAAVGGGRIFVTPSSYFGDGVLISLDAVSGAENWRYTVGSASSMNPPTYAGGKVYFQNGKGTSTPPSQLSCLDARDGHNVWTMPVAAQWESYYAPTVANGGVWVDGGYYGGMYGFDALTGVQKFFLSLAQYDEWTPTIGPDGTVYTWVAGTFTAHNPNSGASQWAVNAAWNWHGWSMDTISAIAGDRAYIIGSPGLSAVDLSKHSVVWSSSNAFIGSPAVANGSVYAMTSAGNVCAFNAGNGKLSMTYATGDSGLTNQPILTNDTLIVASNSKTYLFELYSGRLLQTLPFGGVPSLAGGRLYLAGADGTLRTYGRPNPNNVPPVAIPGSVTINEDTSTVIQLQGSDANNDPIKAVITKLPAGGTLYQTADGVTAGVAITQTPATVANTDHKVFYRPAANANGTGYGTFEFLMSDAYTYSPSAQYTVNVTPVNDAPVANDDTAATQPGQLLSPICVLNNDVDVDGDPLTIVSFTQGSYGDVKLNSDGSFSYLPHNGVNEAQDSFRYVIRDPSGLTSSATVRIYVSANAGTNWPTFGGGADHTGYTPVNLGTGAWTAGWNYTISGHSLQQVAVEDGVVVLAPSSSPDTFIVGLNAIDGTQKWRHDFAQAFSLCPPSVANGNVYIQRGNAYNDTQLWCLSATNGTTVWSSPFGAQWDCYFAPAVSSSGIWINGGNYGGLYGFNTNGTQKFFASLPQYDRWTPSIGADGTVYSWVEGIFTAHQPDTGAKLWSVNAGWDWWGWSMNTTTALSGGKAFAIGSPGLFAIDLNGHTITWSSTGSFVGSPAAAGGVVYAISGNKVSAFNAGSGVLLTIYSTGDAGTLINQPIVTNDLLFVSSPTKTYIFELYTARLLQTLNAGGYLSLANKVLYIAGTDGTLRTYNAPTALWFSPDGALSDNPVNVALTAANPCATIFYSLDGSSPQLSKRTVSSGGVVRIESTCTLKAVALSGNNQVSPVKQAQYIITDSNNNGLPDWWERLHYGSLKSSIGVQDITAFVAGADPVQPRQILGNTSMKATAGGFEITWPSVQGRAYIVERSSDLQNWTPVSNELTGVGGNMSFADLSVPKNGKGFYRVRISQ